MLSPSTPFWGLPCGVPRFWRLRIAKEFDKPKYYIGQTVVHVVNRLGINGRFYVDVLGLVWNGQDWQYCILIPEDHPDFKSNQSDWDWVDDKELTLP